MSKAFVSIGKPIEVRFSASPSNSGPSNMTTGFVAEDGTTPPETQSGMIAAGSSLSHNVVANANVLSMRITVAFPEETASGRLQVLEDGEAVANEEITGATVWSIATI